MVGVEAGGRGESELTMGERKYLVLKTVDGKELLYGEGILEAAAQVGQAEKKTGMAIGAGGPPIIPTWYETALTAEEFQDRWGPSQEPEAPHETVLPEPEESVPAPDPKTDNGGFLGPTLPDEFLAALRNADKIAESAGFDVEYRLLRRNAG